MSPLLKRSVILILLILFLDQILKIWIKTNMYLGEEYKVTDFFLIHFTENNGMAFGLELGGKAGKLALSLFRILASVGLGWYLLKLIREKAHAGLITCFSFIFAGAVGNIIDSTFYGLIFSDSIHGVARLFPDEGGYAGLFHGRVVDMFYFPIFWGQFPEWLPFWGGEPFMFFRPVFNIADSAITIGVFLFIIFQNKFSSEKEKIDPSSETKEEQQMDPMKSI